MAMNQPPRLVWRLSRRAPWPMLAVASLCIAGCVALLAWKQALDLRSADYARAADRIARGVPRPAPTRAPAPVPSATAMRQWQEQAALLNRDWVALSGALAPRVKDVRLLGLDVNPQTGAIRVTGEAASALAANAYAESLGLGADALRRVRLLGLERRAGAVRFEVVAQWQE